MSLARQPAKDVLKTPLFKTAPTHPSISKKTIAALPAAQGQSSIALPKNAKTVRLDTRAMGPAKHHVQQATGVRVVPTKKVAQQEVSERRKK
jgi:hypothetical protein